jgi:sec-independent protein translocase protein TatB
MFGMGTGELVLILVIAFILLGPQAFPDLARGAGKLLRDLRRASSDLRDQIEIDEELRKPLEDLRGALRNPLDILRPDPYADRPAPAGPAGPAGAAGAAGEKPGPGPLSPTDGSAGQAIETTPSPSSASSTSSGPLPGPSSGGPSSGLAG